MTAPDFVRESQLLMLQEDGDDDKRLSQIIEALRVMYLRGMEDFLESDHPSARAFADIRSHLKRGGADCLEDAVLLAHRLVDDAMQALKRLPSTFDGARATALMFQGHSVRRREWEKHACIYLSNMWDHLVLGKDPEFYATALGMISQLRFNHNDWEIVE